MTYFISDVHGEYDLFLKLLDKISFSASDKMYVLGDMTGKGVRSIELVDFIRRASNIKAILGNHEYDFLKYYHSLMQVAVTPADIDYVFEKLRKYFSGDRAELSWDTVDCIDTLPFYVETDDFLCVHAGAEADKNGKILPLKDQLPEFMVYSREFKEDYYALDAENKTVLFGHTPCSYNNSECKFIKTPKKGISNPKKLTDYSKIRLDCGVFITGSLGALRLEDMSEFYVDKY